MEGGWKLCNFGALQQPELWVMGFGMNEWMDGLGGGSGGILFYFIKFVLFMVWYDDY